MTDTKILPFANKALRSVPDVTTNQVDHYLLYLHELTKTMEFHAGLGPRHHSIRDLEQLREAIILASFVGLRLTALRDLYGDELPEQYDFAPEMTKLIATTQGICSETVQSSPISIAMVVEVKTILETIVESYYTAKIKRPWWHFWF